MDFQRFYNIVLPILCRLSVFSTLSSDMVTLTDIGLENIRCLGIVIKVITNFGFLMCARECEQNEMCTGFNFGTSLLACELLNATMKTEKETGWRFVDNVTWLQETGLSKIPRKNACASQGRNIRMSSGEIYCQSRDYFPIDCSVYALIPGHSQNGVYRIEPVRDMLMDVYCDMDGGGWTVFQRRMDGTVDFYRNWDDYKNGFGDVTGNFWVGNEKLHKMSSAHAYKLRIDMQYFNGTRMFAEFLMFRVAGEEHNFALNIGQYSGDAGDAYTHLNNIEFSTLDRDNDIYGAGSCARMYQGGWWYKACVLNNLNGKYYDSGKCPYGDGITWQARGLHEKYISLKNVVMKVKRKATQ